MAHQIVLAGVDYRRAPVEVREELSFNREQALRLLPQLIEIENVSEALLLATCNRTEFYLAYDGHSPVDSLLETLKRTRPHARSLHQDCLRFVESGERAAWHLFCVAAGIDSQILGDTHIVMQVKQAHRIAAEAGTLGPLVDRTVTESLRAAKRARRETAIGKGAVSVGAAVLRSLRRFFPDQAQARVMILGGGDAGRDIACHLSKVRLAGLTFAARNPEQAARMAQEYRGQIVGWEHVPAQLAVIDVLVTATSARLAFLDRDSVERLSRGRGQHLLIVDAGIPRNVDAAVGELPDVRLLNLDSLDREQEQALAARQAEVPRVEAILTEELDRWRQWRLRRSPEFSPEWTLPRKFGPAILNTAGAEVPVPTAKG